MQLNSINLPPGVGQVGIEIMHAGELTFLCNGLAQKFEEIPINVLTVFAQALDADDKANEALDDMELIYPMERLKQYVSCNFGGYDNSCDLQDGQLHPEYWDCGHRNNCPHEGKLCKLMQSADKLETITPREVEVMKNIATGMPDKQIAERMGISFFTVRNHLRALYRKTNSHCKASLIMFAKNNNVI